MSGEFNGPNDLTNAQREMEKSQESPPPPSPQQIESRKLAARERAKEIGKRLKPIGTKGEMVKKEEVPPRQSLEDRLKPLTHHPSYRHPISPPRKSGNSPSTPGHRKRSPSPPSQPAKRWPPSMSSSRGLSERYSGRWSGNAHQPRRRDCRQSRRV